MGKPLAADSRRNIQRARRAVPAKLPDTDPRGCDSEGRENRVERLPSMASATMTENDQQLAFVFQYTVEAYKQFQKFAEILQNPMSAATFKRFAEDERQNRDLLEIRY